MKKELFTVGQVSKITGIPKATLRYYDNVGLLRPSVKGPDNQYRYYSVDQFWYMDLISCFRKLGMPIEKIKMALASEDNGYIVSLLQDQRREVERLRDYYAGVVEDIDWYCEQNQRIAQYRAKGEIRVDTLPERRVIYGTNPEEENAYHFKLQENCREESLHTNSIKRSYGYVLHPEALRENRFQVRGEYVSIGGGTYLSTKPEHIMTIPGGRYACFVTEVCGQEADFSPLIRWLDQTGENCSLVIADEIGLQLFNYNRYRYPCEIKAYLDPLPQGEAAPR